MTLDRGRFPRASEYLDALPNGLESYPECLVKTNRQDDACAEFGERLRGEVLPERIKRLVAGEHAEEWLSEVVGSAFYLMLRDVAFEDDDEFLSWYHETVARLYSRPLYRVIMFVMSPTLVVMGAAKRWDTFHQGSSLVAGRAEGSDSRMVTQGRLTFPPRLFNQLMIRLLGKSFEAAIGCAGGKDVQVDVSRYSDTEGLYRISWGT